MGHGRVHKELYNIFNEKTEKDDHASIIVKEKKAWHFSPLYIIVGVKAAPATLPVF
jgi:hypothetical protein